MKLKLLLFPLAMAVAVWASIWVIKPEIIDIRNDLQAWETQKVNLENVKKKQQTINLLINNLNENENKEKIVMEYMPTIREEEEIINKVYQRATDAKVKLESLAISDSREKTKTAAVPAKTVVDPDMPLRVEFLKTNVTVSGTYDEIRTFLNYLRTMEKINHINSVEIGEKGAEGNNEEGGGGKALPKGVLAATIDADFRFFLPVEVAKEADLPVFAKSAFDFATVDKVEKLLAEKVADVTTGKAGKKNPFTP